MAKAKSCSMCEKGAGAYFCIGCEAYFCKKDYHHHREHMGNELEGFIGDRNDLQDKINKATQQNDSNSPLLIQIDQWQKVTIEKVKQVAEQARQQVLKSLNSKKVEIKGQFEKFSQELIQLKETEDFVEHDLQRLKETVDQLNQDLKRLGQAPAIELHMEQSDQVAWDSLIYVEERSLSTLKQERQHQVKGKFIDRLPYSYT